MKPSTPLRPFGHGLSYTTYTCGDLNISSKEITFTITPDKLAFYDKKMNWIVEPGESVVMVGASSADEQLLSDTFVVKK